MDALDQAARTAALRILDANFNRAGEGLRVVEDYVRFALDDGFLSQQLKQLRHDLSQIQLVLPLGELAAARESQQDVGAEATTASEYRRESAIAVATANLKRAEQSLRAIEEYAKVIDVVAARRCEALRYRLYTLEKSILLRNQADDRLAECRLYALLEGRADVAAFEQLAQQLIAGGVDAIQLRDKRLSDRELLDRAVRLRSLTRAADVLFVMNDRPDLALLSHADGVHLGQDEIPVKDVRRLAGSRLLIGVSTHSLEQAQQAVLDGADYLGVGPTFPSTTKTFADFPGEPLLKAVAAEIGLPCFAIGGITLDNLGTVLAAGFCRAAVSGALLSAPDPLAAAKTWSDRLHRPAKQA